MRLNASQRSLIPFAVGRHIKIARICEVLGISPKTARKWAKRKLFTDLKRTPKESKITVEVEYSVLALRNSLRWGTARIQQGLQSLPQYILDTIPGLVQGINLSRPAINGILTAHKLNGYSSKHKRWKFFRAKRPDELWQIDLKEHILHGRKHYFLVVIDDYSRYLLVFRHFDRCPSSADIWNAIIHIVKHRKPQNILSDNGCQFREQWKRLLRQDGITPLFAHPYYPQDKGKVERTIRNVTEEFVEHINKWPEWLDNIFDYVQWFNHQRLHRGIWNYPANEYLET